MFMDLESGWKSGYMIMFVVRPQILFQHADIKGLSVIHVPYSWIPKPAKKSGYMTMFKNADIKSLLAIHMPSSWISKSAKKVGVWYLRPCLKTQISRIFRRFICHIYGSRNLSKKMGTWSCLWAIWDLVQGHRYQGSFSDSYVILVNLEIGWKSVYMVMFVIWSQIVFKNADIKGLSTIDIPYSWILKSAEKSGYMIMFLAWSEILFHDADISISRVFWPFTCHIIHGSRNWVRRWVYDHVLGPAWDV